MIKLSSFGGSSGGFKATFVSGGISVAPGATGTYITITPPSGERVMLDGLAALSAQTNLTTVLVGGSAVATDLKIWTSIEIAGSLRIGYGSGSQPVIGGVNEAIEISTDVATSSSTYYHYQFGV